MKLKIIKFVFVLLAFSATNAFASTLSIEGPCDKTLPANGSPGYFALTELQNAVDTITDINNDRRLKLCIVPQTLFMSNGSLKGVTINKDNINITTTTGKDYFYLFHNATSTAKPEPFFMIYYKNNISISNAFMISSNTPRSGMQIGLSSIAKLENLGLYFSSAAGYAAGVDATQSTIGLIKDFNIFSNKTVISGITVFESHIHAIFNANMTFNDKESVGISFYSSSFNDPQYPDARLGVMSTVNISGGDTGFRFAGTSVGAVYDYYTTNTRLPIEPTNYVVKNFK